MATTLRSRLDRLNTNRKTVTLAATLVAMTCAAPTTSWANDADNFAAASPWGRYFAMAPFAKRPLDVTIATNKKTGETMNVVKLGNGHLMVLVPVERYMALMGETRTEDMIPTK